MTIIMLRNLDTEQYYNDCLRVIINSIIIIIIWQLKKKTKK